MRQLLALSLAAACASASTFRTAQFRSIGSCGSAAHGHGTIEGHLIPDSAGIHLQRGVSVDQFRCFTISDASGSYRLQGLPPGTYMLGVGDLGVRHVPPISVRVGPDSTTMVDIRLRPENLVLDCQEDSLCAPLLAPMDTTVLKTLSTEDQLLELALRTAVAISGFATEQSRRPGAVCVGKNSGHNSEAPPDQVFKVLRTRIPIVRPPTDCHFVAREHGGELRTPDGLWAWGYEADVSIAADTFASSTSSYYVGPLWAAGWSCTYERDLIGWHPRSCRLAWIS